MSDRLQMDKAFATNYRLAAEFAAGPQGFFNAIVANNPEGSQRCFHANSGRIKCVDERLSEGEIAIAGSFCLMEQPTQAVEYARQRAAAYGISSLEISSHQGCGAAAMKNVDPRQFSTQLAQQTGLPYAGHFQVSPAEFHDAVAIYYSGTPTLSFQHLPGMPKGFCVNRPYHRNASTAVYEAEVCIQIAMGDHGLGQRFTSQQPLLLVALGDESQPEFNTQVLVNELTPLASEVVKVVPIMYGAA